MNQRIDSAALKNKAKICMEGKYYVIVMTIVFFSMASLFFQRVSSSLTRQIYTTLYQRFGIFFNDIDVMILSMCMSFLITGIFNIFRIGMSLFFLNIACNQPFNSFDLFHGFHETPGRSLALSFFMTLLDTLMYAPANIVLYLYFCGFRFSMTDIYVLAAAQIALILIVYPLTLAFSQVYFVHLDYPEMSFGEILKYSRKIMKGRKRSLFYLQASFLPMYLILLLTFGLATFWLTPYFNMTYSLYYLDIMKDRQASSPVR